MKFYSMKLAALLSAALMVASAPAISANIPAMVNDYPSVNPIFVSLMTTIPSLFLILGVFFTSSFEKKIGRKNTILLGLIMVGVFGTLPAWYQGSFVVLFISRCLLGFGIGLFNRLLIQMISSLYQHSNNMRAKALGLESAFEGLGGIILTIAVGQLLRIDWSLSFIVYGLAFLAVILISIFISDKKSADKDAALNTTRFKDIPGPRKIKMLSLGFLLFCIVMLFINYNLQITPLLIEQQIGDATNGSNMIAAIAVGAFIAGNLFGRTYSLLKNWVLPVAAFGAGLSIFLTTISSSVLFTLLCSVGLGFSFRNIMPFFMHLFTSGGETLAKFGTTIVLVAYNIGATVSPYSIQMIAKIGGNLNASFQMTVSAILLGLISIIVFVFNKKLSFD